MHVLALCQNGSGNVRPSFESRRRDPSGAQRRATRISPEASRATRWRASRPTRWSVASRPGASAQRPRPQDLLRPRLGGRHELSRGDRHGPPRDPSAVGQGRVRARPQERSGVGLETKSWRQKCNSRFSGLRVCRRGTQESRTLSAIGSSDRVRAEISNSTYNLFVLPWVPQHRLVTRAKRIVAK